MFERAGSIVVAWAAGWAAAVVLLATWFSVGGSPDLSPVHLPAWILAGSLAFGFPAFVAGRRAAAPRPFVEALAWTTTCALAIVVVRSVLIDWYVPEPGEVNAVTIEPGRGVSYRSPILPPEMVLLISVVVGGGFVAGGATGLLRKAGALRLVALAAASAGALLSAAFCLIVVAPIVVHIAVGGAEWLGQDALAAMVALPAIGAIGGAGAGTIMESLHQRA